MERLKELRQVQARDKYLNQYAPSGRVGLSSEPSQKVTSLRRMKLSARQKQEYTTMEEKSGLTGFDRHAITTKVHAPSVLTLIGKDPNAVFMT